MGVEEWADDEIDALPQALTRFESLLPTPYRAEAFTVPPSWRAWLRTHRSLSLFDHAELFAPVDLWAPSLHTLTRSCVPSGTTVEDREITTTGFLSFANAGFSTEASRWCFFTGAAL